MKQQSLQEVAPSNIAGRSITVGLSGGVDSSLAAALLLAGKANVSALFMRNWTEEDGSCTAQLDGEDAALVAAQLGIPVHTIDLSQTYWDRVFQKFIAEYEAGYTPNPDLLCNREVKFDAFLQRARALGAEWIATGHYARILWRDGHPFLARAVDASKDQSYFLAAVHREAFRHVLFPLGHLTKKCVREHAAALGLATAAKRDSTGICFIGKRAFRPFLSKYVAHRPGPFLTPEGVVVGEHCGLSFYTIGQRRGLGIGGEGEAWYVVGKSPAQNAVIVVQGDLHPALFCQELTASELNWLAPLDFPLYCSAKVRYRSEDVPCTVLQIDEDRVQVCFEQPVRAVTPRQAVVFYQGEICLGCGWIEPRAEGAILK